MKIKKIIILLLIVIPLIFDGWFVLKRQWSIGVAYNVASSILHADFNGDGRLDEIIIEEKNRIQKEFVVKIDDKEVFRRPYVVTDGSFRTRIATTRHHRHYRLLVFDGTSGQFPYKAVLEYDGNVMREVEPTSYENTALSSMARNDDGGMSSLDWIKSLYWLMRIPILIIYYCILFFAVFKFKGNQRKAQQGS